MLLVVSVWDGYARQKRFILRNAFAAFRWGGILMPEKEARLRSMTHDRIEIAGAD